MGARGLDGGGRRRRIAVRLHVLSRQLRAGFDRAAGALGVTRSQWQMIAAVGVRPGTTQRILAEMLEMSEASAGRLIDRLCAEGLLERRAREDDRRARAIFLTARADLLRARLNEIAKESEARLFLWPGRRRSGPPAGLS